jgi:hypothetical protein
VVRITGQATGRAADHAVALYRPRFVRMRHGRLLSPARWAERTAFKLSEPLTWLHPDDDAQHESELKVMAALISPEFRHQAVEISGERPDTLARVTLAHHTGLVVIELALFEDGCRRPSWVLGEELYDRAIAAVGLRPEPVVPTLSVNADESHRPQDFFVNRPPDA